MSSHVPADRKPKIAIVGAGIAGLTLAILLDKQGVEYNVYERALEVRQLGSTIGLGANVATLFQQMGIYDEFTQLGKVWSEIQIFNDKLEHDRTMDFTAGVEAQGSPGYIISRPALYDLLLQQIPKERVHFGYRVLSFTENEDGVMIQVSHRSVDGQDEGVTAQVGYHADILIGADGAYSAIRKNMYADLASKEVLPVMDGMPLPYACVCLVGQTTLLDKEKFPHLGLDESQFIKVLGKDTPYTWSTFTTKQDTICWSVVQFLEEENFKKTESDNNLEWGPEAVEQMCLDVRHLLIPGAAPRSSESLTLGDLIDQTPKELISKVMLEEKVFDTWYSGRTALIGDACHKINPAGGVGAVNAIHDAVTIANWISTLSNPSIRDLEKIFQAYKEERYPLALQAFKSSQMFRNISSKTFKAKAMRMVTKYMPQWLWSMAMSRMVTSRPQASFLPLVEDKGRVKPAHQPSLEETLKIAQAKKQEGGVELSEAIHA